MGVSVLRFGTLLEPWRLDSAPVRGITSMTNMATRHVAPPGFPAPQRRSRQAKSSPGQPSLSRKERQQAYLVRDLVAELEHKHGTNTVHAINFSFGKRSTSVSIVLHRERGIQDTHMGSTRSPTAHIPVTASRVDHNPKRPDHLICLQQRNGVRLDGATHRPNGQSIQLRWEQQRLRRQRRQHASRT